MAGPGDVDGLEVALRGRFQLLFERSYENGESLSNLAPLGLTKSRLALY